MNKENIKVFRKLINTIQYSTHNYLLKKDWYLSRCWNNDSSTIDGKKEQKNLKELLGNFSKNEILILASLANATYLQNYKDDNYSIDFNILKEWIASIIYGICIAIGDK